ncbi:hypothetical protein HMPREF3207_03560 [Citrobacter koseri]|nr:hypothetical protein HMPREF3207_03560 [Citrobacter koseri]
MTWLSSCLHIVNVVASLCHQQLTRQTLFVFNPPPRICNVKNGEKRRTNEIC